MKKSFMTRVLAVTLSAAMAFSLSSATSLTTPEAATKKLAANKKAASVSLKVGKSTTLKLKSYKTWNITKAKSNKTKVATAKLTKKAKATVKVTAKKKGTAVVTLTLTHKKNAKDPIKKKVTVKVTKAATTTDTTPTDTTPTDTTPTDTTTDSAIKVTPGALYISDLKATQANELTVSFANPIVSTGAVKFTVQRGSVTVETDKITWKGTTGAAITTTGNMPSGTYVVTATDGVSKTEASVEVEAQKVDQIVILNDVALTEKATLGVAGANPTNIGVDGGTEGAVAYIYYDVLDQYGNSIRNSTSLTWSFSCNKVSEDKNAGRIIVARNDAKSFTYGEQIFVNATYTKTGVNANKTLTVGQAQAIDSIEFKGFAKKNTSTLVQTLPAGFKSDVWYIVFAAKDQNGCTIDTSAKDIASTDVTFFANDPLLIKEVALASATNNYTKNFTIDEITYYAAVIQPGMNVNKGGTTTLNVTANRTGNRTEVPVVVGDYQVLASFEFSTPADIVADGEKVEIPFKAYDTNQKEITDFETIAMQSTFNKLTLTASEGNLILSQKDDGTAKLEWQDANMPWTDSRATDGIDRTVSLTSVVVGAGSNNMMISVQDKSRPASIKSVDMDDYQVAGSTVELDLASFSFLDQYGRDMVKVEDAHGAVKTYVKDDGDKRVYAYDNGFFAATYLGTVPGTDFSGYQYAVKAYYNGSDTGYYDTTSTVAPQTISGNKAETGVLIVDTNTSAIDAVAPTANCLINANAKTVVTRAAIATSLAAITGVSSDQNFRFAISRFKTGTELEDVSANKTDSFRIVSIDRLTSFEVPDVDPLKIDTGLEDIETGAIAGLNSTNVSTAVQNVITGTNGPSNTTVAVDSDYASTVEVKAKYNGTTVDVPSSYLGVESTKILANTVASGVVAAGNVKLQYMNPAAMLWSDLYDATSAQFVRKMGSENIKVHVYGVVNGAITTATANQVTTITKNVKFTDDASRATTILAKDAVTVSPTMTVYNFIPNNGVSVTITNGESSLIMDKAKLDTEDYVIIKDQYNKNITAGVSTDVTAKVTNVVENAAGYADNNFTVSNNDSIGVYVTGAERGDTFTLTLSADNGNVTKAIKVTVGADDAANITNSTNNYTDYLINGVANVVYGGSAYPVGGLEVQRQASLGN